MREVRETLVAPHEPEPVRGRPGVPGAGRRRHPAALRAVPAPPGRSHGVPRHARPVRGRRSAASFTERFGAAPSAGRAEEVAEALRAFYRDRGYPRRRSRRASRRPTTPIARRWCSTSRPARGRSIGRRRRGRDRRQRPGPSPAASPIRAGDPYDNDAILRELERYEALLHARGFYEARAVHTLDFEPTAPPP